MTQALTVSLADEVGLFYDGPWHPANRSFNFLVKICHLEAQKLADMGDSVLVPQFSPPSE